MFNLLYEYIINVLYQKVLVGTLHDRTKICLSIRADCFCFLMVHYSNTYHINVFLHNPITMNERDVAQ